MSTTKPKSTSKAKTAATADPLAKLERRVQARIRKTEARLDNLVRYIVQATGRHPEGGNQ